MKQEPHRHQVAKLQLFRLNTAFWRAARVRQLRGSGCVKVRRCYQNLFFGSSKLPNDFGRTDGLSCREANAHQAEFDVAIGFIMPSAQCREASKREQCSSRLTLSSTTTLRLFLVNACVSKNSTLEVISQRALRRYKHQQPVSTACTDDCQC